MTVPAFKNSSVSDKKGRGLGDSASPCLQFSLQTPMRALLVLVGVAPALAADPRVPHQHNGVFKRYQPGPPKSAGFRLSKADSERISRTHQPECSVESLPVTETSPKGTMRCTSVQDVDAPPDIVWSLLLDFPRYPKFVGGIVGCQPYSKRRTLTGGKMVCATYTAAVGPFRLGYFVDHHFEPIQHSMVWTLDYSRSSDIFDSVGYWYVESRAGGTSRVYYTQDTLLPNWIPGKVRKTFTKVAMRAATSKLEPACKMEMKRRSEGNQFPGLRALSRVFKPDQH